MNFFEIPQAPQLIFTFSLLINGKIEYKEIDLKGCNYYYIDVYEFKK